MNTGESRHSALLPGPATVRMVCLFALGVGAISPTAVLPDLRSQASKTAAFLEALEGTWEGQAQETPIGPRPYDIRFVSVGRNRLEGAAHPGRAIHYWAFREDHNVPALCFLSTFAGNRTPIHLYLATWENGAAIFKAIDPEFLNVKVVPRTDALQLDVYHRGRQHVAIRLTRSIRARTAPLEIDELRDLCRNTTDATSRSK